MLPLRQNLSNDLRPREYRTPHFGFARATDQEYLLETDLGAYVSRDFFDPKNVAFGNSILFSAGANHCVHRKPLFLGAAWSGRRPQSGEGRALEKRAFMLKMSREVKPLASTLPRNGDLRKAD
jgi:hypothetical protein